MEYWSKKQIWSCYSLLQHSTTPILPKKYNLIFSHEFQLRRTLSQIKCIAAPRSVQNKAWNLNVSRVFFCARKRKAHRKKLPFKILFFCQIHLHQPHIHPFSCILLKHTIQAAFLDKLNYGRIIYRQNNFALNKIKIIIID